VSSSLPGSSNRKRRYGFGMSLLGMVMNGLGGIIVYVVVIILTQTLSGEAAQSSYVPNIDAQSLYEVADPDI
jgi:hypothetical protein